MKSAILAAVLAVSATGCATPQYDGMQHLWTGTVSIYVPTEEPAEVKLHHLCAKLMPEREGRGMYNTACNLPYKGGTHIFVAIPKDQFRSDAFREWGRELLRAVDSLGHELRHQVDPTIGDLHD